MDRGRRAWPRIDATTTEEPVTTGEGAERAAGWYADPWVHGQQRYWTGSDWAADVFADALDQQANVDFASRYGAAPTTPADPPPPPPTWAHRVPAASVPVVEQSTPTPPPSGPSQRMVAAIAAGLIAAVVLMVGGGLWLRSATSDTSAAPATSASPAPSPSPTQPQSPSPTPSPSTTGEESPQSQGSVEDALQALVLQQRDVPDRYRVAPIDGGRSVTDQPTLDLCDGTYPSETERVGRLQVSARDGAGSTTLSTEAVQYSSTEATAQAFAEAEQVAAQCKGSLTLDFGSGTPVETTVTEDADRNWHTTPGVERLAYTVADTDMISGAESQQVVVYLRRGPLFMGLYFPNASGKQMPVEGKTTIPEIVRIFEERLLNTPPGDASQVPPPDLGSSPGPTDGGSGAIGA